MAKKIQAIMEGIEGLKEKPKSGKHPKLSTEIEYKIKTILRESNRGWTPTKQVEKIIIIIKESEKRVRYHHDYIYRVKKWGFKQNLYPRIVHVNTASAKEEKKEIKKKDKQDTCGR